MSFEEFDKRIREAAEHHHPSYDEKAWKDMKKLLDKHLPEEDNRRRRIIFFLLFALLLGGGTTFLLLGLPGKKGNETETAAHKTKLPGRETAPVNVPEQQKENEKPATKAIEPGQAGNDAATPVLTDKPATERTSDNAQPVADPLQMTKPTGVTVVKKQKNNRPSQENRTAKNVAEKRKSITGARTGSEIARTKTNDTDEKNAAGNATIPEKLGKFPVADNKQVATDKPSVTNDKPAAADKPVVQQDNKPVAADKPTVQQDNSKLVQLNKADVPLSNTEAAAQRKNKPQKKSKNSFSFTLSAGPDISFATSEKWGKTKLVLGAGVGYTINNRFLIRTGFFTAQKVYDATANSYNPPSYFSTLYPYLYEINADCRVYEIPLLFSYRIGRSDKQSWLLTTGLSSYIMKKEKYDYTYSYVPSGPLYKHTYALENENTHLFSVLTLSGGYQRKIGKNISLMAEPYLKLPLSGVGFGKVKLNSGGVLFTIGIQPSGNSPRNKKRQQ